MQSCWIRTVVKLFLSRVLISYRLLFPRFGMFRRCHIVFWNLMFGLGQIWDARKVA